MPRELIDTGTDKRFVRRDKEGRFEDSDDVGRSLAQDQKRDSRTKPKKGEGTKATADDQAGCSDDVHRSGRAGHLRLFICHQPDAVLNDDCVAKEGRIAPGTSCTATLSPSLLNGPLGIGKSTLGEVLGEALERSVTLDGDQLLALNPLPDDENGALHEVVALLVRHHLSRGYDRLILNHYWSSAEQISDLEARLQSIAPRFEVHCFRLTLPKEENLRRIALRQRVRAIDETEFEAEHFAEEHALLTAAGDELGVSFDVSDPPDVLAVRLIEALGI